MFRKHRTSFIKAGSVVATGLSVLLGAGCDPAAELDEPEGLDDERAVALDPWRLLRLSVLRSTDRTTERHEEGLSVADTDCRFESTRPMAACLEVVSAPALDDDPCRGVPHAGFDGLEPQLSVDLWLSDTRETSRLWFDPAAPDAVTCIEVFVDSPQDAACVYKNCLAGGAEYWIEAVFDAYADELHAPIDHAVRDAGAPLLGRAALNRALLDALGTTTQGERMVARP